MYDRNLWLRKDFFIFINSKSMLDNYFNREGSMSQLRKSSQMRSSGMRRKADPYHLDFTQLRQDYENSSSVKIPFVKSSFVHYSKCPRNLKINGHEYHDLVVTMEVIQAPELLNYTQLDDPVVAREKAKIASRKAAFEKKKAEVQLARAVKKHARVMEKAARKAERAAAKREREIRRNNRIQTGEGTDDDEETEDDETEESEEDVTSSDDDEELEVEEKDCDEDGGQDDDEEEDEDEDEDEDDDASQDQDDSKSEQEDDQEGEEGEDREYQGDMFKKNKPIKFMASPFEKQGQHNAKLETNDYCCITLWSAGGRLQRYTRLKDTVLSLPPIETDQKFRVGHSAKRLYYIGQQEGTKKLVIINLQDLTHEIHDLGPDSAEIETFKDSSLLQQHICYATPSREEVSGQGKKFWRKTKNFHIFNFKTQEKVWELPDSESVFFVGKEAKELKSVKFNDVQIKHRLEPLENSESEDESGSALICEEENVDDIDSEADEAQQVAETETGKQVGNWEERINCIHKGIIVFKSKYEDRNIEPEQSKNEKKDFVELKGPADTEAKSKVCTVRKIQAFMPQWAKPVNNKRLAFETELEIKMAPVQQKKSIVKTTESNKHTQLKQLQENELLIVSDFMCNVVTLIIKGVLGEQHRVNTFKTAKRSPTDVSLRAGNIDLQFNMNSHIRNIAQIFICETAPNGDVIAKQVQAQSQEDDGVDQELPPVIMSNAERGLAKDCWTQNVGEEGTLVMTISKSATDEYLNADCTIVRRLEPTEDELVRFSTKRTASSIKAQEIDLNYPCLVSNVGLSRLTIQSLTCPDQVSQFNLDNLKMEFICFAEYRTLEDIGFKDSRDAAQADIVPFNETGDKIAFLTRKFGVCENQCSKGDILLNVLSIDSYSQPMKFELYTTQYEACMDEGMNDDAVRCCVAMQVSSMRGLDVAFVAQYNDRIIYDCITSTTQRPLRFPLPANNKVLKLWRDSDPDFKKNDGDIQFEQLDVLKGAKMIKQSMVMDEHGAIYFMIKSNETIQVLRTDPLIEMGGAGFIKSIFSLRSTCAYFLLYREGIFYLMDDQKQIRVLRPSLANHTWRQDRTLVLPEADAKQIVYNDFDEYCISNGVLQTNEHMFFLLDSRAKDNATWESAQIMLKNHLHISGPRYAQESGLIWYIQQYASGIKAADDEEQDFGQGMKWFEKLKQCNHGNFKGYSVVMQPLGDLSYLDLLPQRGSNNKNFVSFVTDSHILINYSGRYLIFNLKGTFEGAVKFTGTQERFRGDKIKLVNVSDSGKYFVFKGPRFRTRAEKDAAKQKNKERKTRKMTEKLNTSLKGTLTQLSNLKQEKLKKKADKNKFSSGGKKSPIFYVFKLKMETKLKGTIQWLFTPHKTELYPIIEPQIKNTMTQRIDHAGVISQCFIKSVTEVDDFDDESQIEIIVKNYKSQDPNKQEPERGIFDFNLLSKESPESEERYRINFTSYSHDECVTVLNRSISTTQRQIELGKSNEQALLRLQRRKQQTQRAWVFSKHIVAKSGSELKYMTREKSVLDGYVTKSIKFAVDPGANIWIENIFATGIKDLIQLFLIDDVERRVYIITWNLHFNREHSIFQSSYAPEIFPESLILKGRHLNKQQDLNYFMDSYAIINLETNLPMQFFDTESEADVLPKGPLHGQVEGMKRISSNWSRYLDMTKPGRVHHFISYADLLYWERYQTLKDKHEISHGIMSTFSPISRFPNGSSVFHFFATNVRVLNAAHDAMQIARQNRSEDPRIKFLPLVFLHSNPKLNEPGKRTTPIHIALDKQSPIAFELMFEMLVSQTKVCVTSQLLDVLGPIINSQAPSVLDFFNNSFLVTDQYAGLRALEWEVEGEEKICAAASAFITDEYLQSLVKIPSTANEDMPDLNIKKQHSFSQNHDSHENDSFDEDEPIDYCSKVEPQAHKAEDSNIKQIEAKILDFNWVFIGDNSGKMIQTLAETDNDEIFAQDQIRVFVDFMWQGYYESILYQLFVPFLFYFASFIAYTGYFAKLENLEINAEFIAKISCIVIFGKAFLTFLIREVIQMKSCGLAYFADAWNLIDLLSLAINAVYVFGEVTDGISFEVLQVVGSIAILFMWIKLFYWMRIFKPFSAFIRMITEIIMDIKVFLVMLFISLCAFANIIFVLNLNRIKTAQNPIFESYIGIPPIDAIMHAYLTGLGDFGKDTYSDDNSQVVWVMFVLATVIVQLIFMNLLIAIMGESFSRITAIMQQCTLKEVCAIMLDHIWLLKIDEIFEDQRYILWLSPDTSTGTSTVIERQLSQLKDLVKTSSEEQEGHILHQIAAVNENVATLAISVQELHKKIQGAGDKEDESKQ